MVVNDEKSVVNIWENIYRNRRVLSVVSLNIELHLCRNMVGVDMGTNVFVSLI